MKRLLSLLLLLAAPAAADDAWLPKPTADLILLDKIRAQPKTVEVKVGASTTLGTLTIQVRSCDARPPDMAADSTAFLDIADSRASGKGFHGWVLANTPSVSQFEDPIYDVRLVACR